MKACEIQKGYAKIDKKAETTKAQAMF